MPARSRYGRVDRLNPEAAARCDRGGEIRRRSELIPEMRWAGNRLVPTGRLCCAQHLDPPHPQDRVVVLPPDPAPVDLPRIDIDVLAADEGVWGELLLVDGEDCLLVSDDEEFLV
jgi:hypothetical protein